MEQQFRELVEIIKLRKFIKDNLECDYHAPDDYWKIIKIKIVEYKELLTSRRKYTIIKN